MFIFLFVIGPIAEIYIMTQVAGRIGGFNTFMTLVASAFLGMSILRTAGMQNYSRMQEKLNRGEEPTREFLQPIYRLLAGLLFIIPGFLSDSLAVLLLLAPTQRLFEKLIKNYFKAQVRTGSVHVQTYYKDVTPHKIIDVTPEKPKSDA